MPWELYMRSTMALIAVVLVAIGLGIVGESYLVAKGQEPQTTVPPNQLDCGFGLIELKNGTHILLKNPKLREFGGKTFLYGKSVNHSHLYLSDDFVVTQNQWIDMEEVLRIGEMDDNAPQVLDFHLEQLKRNKAKEKELSK
jgi:hypothetical protein